MHGIVRGTGAAESFLATAYTDYTLGVTGTYHSERQRDDGIYLPELDELRSIRQGA